MQHAACASTGPHLQQRAAHALRQGAVDHSAAVAHQVHQLIVRHRRMVHDAGPSHAPIVGSISAGSVGRLHVRLRGGACGPDALEEPALALLMQACTQSQSRHSLVACAGLSPTSEPPAASPLQPLSRRRYTTLARILELPTARWPGAHSSWCSFARQVMTQAHVREAWPSAQSRRAALLQH